MDQNDPSTIPRFQNNAINKFKVYLDLYAGLQNSLQAVAEVQLPTSFIFDLLTGVARNHGLPVCKFTPSLNYLSSNPKSPSIKIFHIQICILLFC